MKRLFAFAGLMTAAVISFTNCQNREIAPDEVLSNGKTIYISASTSIDSKTTNDGFHTLWEAEDSLNVFYKESGDYVNLGKATIADGAGTTSATLAIDVTGPVGPPSGAATWYALFPYQKNITTPGEKTSGYSFIGDTRGLTQDGFDNKANLSKSACPMYAIAQGNGTAVNLSMKQLTSVVEFNINNGTGKNIVVNSVTLTASEDIIGHYFIDFSTDTPVYTKRNDNNVKNSAVVNVENGSLAAGAVGKVYLPIKPYTQSGALKVVVAFTIDDVATSQTVELPAGDGATFVAGKIKRVNVGLVAADTSSKTVAEVLAGESGSTYLVNNAVVTLVYHSGFFISDGTGTILVYQGADPTIQPGSMVSVNGELSTYSGMLQFNKPIVDVISTGNAVNKPSPVAWDAKELGAGEAVSAYVSLTATVTAVGSPAYKASSATVEGATNTLSVYPGFIPEVTIEKDKKYNMTGYIYGFNNGKYSYYIDKAEEATSQNPPQEGTVVSTTMIEYAQANKCTISSGSDVTIYKVLDLSAAVRMMTTGSANCGAFYYKNSNQTDVEWRLYQGSSGNVIVKVANGCSLKSVKFTFSANNNGVLNDSTGSPLTSNTAVEVSGTSVEFTVGNSGEATNGQIRITAVEVVYTGSGTLDPEPQGETETTLSVPSSLTVYIGETAELGATSNVSQATITYESEDESIATVSSTGVISGIAEGNVKIWARIEGVAGQYTSAERYCNVNVTEKPDQTTGSWVATNFASLANGDQFVLVSTKGSSSYAMANDKGTSGAPTAVAVTINGNQLASAPMSNLVWEFTKSENEVRFKLVDEDKYLYTTASNNGLRVGTNQNNVITMDSGSGYLTLSDGEATRFIGVYNNQDWRGYTSVNNNIKDQTFTFYKKQ